ncbi:MAG: beta-galactosidase [Armatimonadetes bacterium]|nr:beta-galactosidase [Armatimonadota bacterium]
MKTLSLVGVACFSALSFAQAKHTFAFGGPNNSEFLLDGKPFQIRSGEIDPGRIPAEYWRHRIQMAKAMGLNTIAPYIFWNDHEQTEGKFDFKSGSRNIGRFIDICREEGMWVLLRPGPYVCGEWDGGGLPWFLWKDPKLKIRSNDDPKYMDAVAKYLHELAKVVKPRMIDRGGPIVMVQIENEYGSYPRHDRTHMAWLEATWKKEGVNGPFSTSDGPAEYNLKDSSLPGAAVGLDSGLSEADWTLARRINPGVPVFSGETYPGWLRHWGEKNWEPSNVSKELKFYMDTKKSFNLYLVHGGTNFGFTTGANSGGKGFEPDLTSYDYGCPINEQGNPTKEYFEYRNLIASYLPSELVPAVPKPISAMEIPAIDMMPISDIWHVLARKQTSVEPKTFAELGQNQGLVVYETKIKRGDISSLLFDKVCDYGLVFVNRRYVGSLDRRLGQKEMELPASDHDQTLDIVVEGMGRINFSAAMETDRKGIFSPKLNGQPLTDWTMYPIPLDSRMIDRLGSTRGMTSGKGQFFRGTFELPSTADTYLDMREYDKGAVWVNGHNLGRYWNIGPQFRLFCPGVWLKKGRNTITVLDLEGTEGHEIRGFKVP